MIINPVNITDKAIDQIRRIMSEKKIPEFYGLRVGVRGGGCRGEVTNMLGFDTRNDYDLEFRIRDITLYLDKRQTMFLVGTTIDYYRDDQEEGFIFLKKSSP
ncbi:MAG: iron-sulfur cluster assembly accessory protein [Cyclobacteriaceae bacterium]|nr:iron-sulfur cluster assembly accessory protein [Cyclobacteriaceae bacterium]